jgi:hypothetical protein
MSYFNDICVTCAIETGKRWIKPGTEASDRPLHESAELDALHPAVPISFRSEEAQLAMLVRAMLIIQEAAPTAATVDLETSDQDTYGFVLTGVQDAEGNDLLPDWGDFKHPLAGLSDEVHDEISDLNWDGVVGEDRGGYVTIDLGEFFAGLSHPGTKLLLAGQRMIEGGN